MTAYLLLRNNKQTGPYSLDELKSLDICADDLLWIEGRSSAWHFPDEFEELQGIIQISPSTNNYQPAAGQPGRSSQPISSPRAEKDIMVTREEGKKSRPLQKDQRPAKPVAPESVELRRNMLAVAEAPFFVKQPASQNHEKPGPPCHMADVIQVVIADDHSLFREGVKTALAQKPDIRVIGDAENGLQLLHLLKQTKPDVILLDIQMPVMDGISALAAIRKADASIKVVVLSMHEGHSMVSALMEAGANGYLTKTADCESIYQAIRTCFEKNYYFNELTNLSMLEGLRLKKKIPEKINPALRTPAFDGEDMMQRLTAARNKSHQTPSLKTQKKIAGAAFGALLIGAGIIAGMNLMGNTSSPPALQQRKVTVLPVPSAAQQALSLIVPARPVADTVKGRDTAVSMTGNEGEDSSIDQKPVAVTDKRPVKKKIKHPEAAVLAVTLPTRDSGAGAAEHPLQMIAVPADPAKAAAREGIARQVTASVNAYHVNTFGGLSGIEITVNNNSNYLVDEAVVEVRYFLSNSKLYKTETLHFQHIGGLSTQVLKAPKSPRGESIEFKVLSVRSKELDL